MPCKFRTDDISYITEVARVEYFSRKGNRLYYKISEEKRKQKMSESYVECLVKAKQPAWAKILKVLLIVLTVLSCLVMFVFIIFLPIALAAGVGAYFLNMYTDLEYEYLYLDKELSVDKIMAKSKRKRVGTYSIDRMEVFAPVFSYHLDNFKNRQVKEKDYSIGEVLQPDGRYAMYYEGGEKIILNPNEELVKAIKNVAPRKVFSE